MVRTPFHEDLLEDRAAYEALSHLPGKVYVHLMLKNIYFGIIIIRRCYVFIPGGSMLLKLLIFSGFFVFSLGKTFIFYFS
jgi:hypothetical protein